RDPETRGWVFTFKLKKGGKIVYQRGDKLIAEMNLRDGEVLSWVNEHSHLYQFERLSRPPQRHARSQEPSEGKRQSDGRLLSPEGAIPHVPDLVPKVEAK